MQSTRRRSQGFTLIELILSVTLLGILTIMVTPFFKMLMGARAQAYAQEQALIDQKVANALLAYAGSNTLLGQLPAPYTGGSYKSTVFNPTDATATSLQPYLLGGNLNPNFVNNDAAASKRVRVYQKVSGLTHTMPMYGQSGPVVTLNYDFGVVYMTICPLDNSSPSCNPNSATGIPGYSPVLTATNYKTWTTDPRDLPATMFSTLPLQQGMLEVTHTRLDNIRDALSGYARAKMLMAAATDTTNFYPAPTGMGAPVLSGGNPATNQGCRDGWYSLNSGVVNVLTQVGLSQAEMGSTAWGGTVQYCRDYDPTGASGANTPPHYAALRVRSAMSLGIAPDNASAANNVIISF